MPYQVWKCSICDKECETKKEAIKCETQKVDPPIHKPGDVVLVETEYIQPKSPEDTKEYYYSGPIIKETVERTVIGIEQGCSQYTPDGGMHDWYVILDEEISELLTDDEGNEYYETTDQIRELHATKKQLISSILIQKI
jgi:hypothetical protein